MQANLKSKKAVITGGAGFIGSHIADELVRQGASVIVLDNLSTGRMSNIQHLMLSQEENLCLKSAL